MKGEDTTEPVISGFTVDDLTVRSVASTNILFSRHQSVFSKRSDTSGALSSIAMITEKEGEATEQ